jgi:hypothetical protein
MGRVVRKVALHSKSTAIEILCLGLGVGDGGAGKVKGRGGYRLRH